MNLSWFVVGLHCIELLQYLLRVPIFKEERFPYEPAISSSSVPYDAKHSTLPKIVKRMKGQRLWGDMVPCREKNCDDIQEEGEEEQDGSAVIR